MNKSLFILYLIIFGSYLLWSRQPDYFDGEKYPATIQLATDSSTNSLIPKAFYSIGVHQYAVDARYPLLSYRSGESVEIIVEHEHPEKASLYRFWGYWITWRELLTSVIMAVLLYQIAVSITSNPSAEALHEQLSYKEEKKTKYD